MADDQHDPRPYGQVLTTYLRDGGALQPVSAVIPLAAGERCFGVASGKLVRQDDEGRWQEARRGLVHVTDRRIVVGGADGAVEVLIDTIRSVCHTPLLVEFEIADGSRLALVLPYPDYWHVLMEQVLARTRADDSARVTVVGPHTRRWRPIARVRDQLQR